jgi:DNA polymerase III delta prime subunit
LAGAASERKSLCFHQAEAGVLPSYTLRKHRKERLPMQKYYAILRFEKLNKWSVTKIANHHERKKDSYKSNPDIDPARTHLNYHIKKPTGTYKQMIAERLTQAKCKTRKDSVLLADTFIGGTHEFLTGLSGGEREEYFRRAYNFMAEQIGEHNIISAVVHLDEKTPHLHLVFTPITPDNRLAAKVVLGNPQRFIKWQDDFYAYMHERYDCIERGQPAKETGRKHIPVRLYKQSSRLNTEVDELRELLSDMSVLNVSKRKKELMERLEKWYKGANSFNGQVKYVVSQNKSMQEENAELTQKLKDTKDNFLERITEKDDFINENMRDYQDLIEQYNDNIAFIESIPADIYMQLRKQFKTQQQEEREADLEIE